MRSKHWLIGGMLLAFTATLAAAEAVWRPVADQVVERLEQAANQYEQGETKTARRAVMQAYFGVFESEKMEAAMRVHLGGSHTYMVERQFGKLRKAIQGGAPQAEVDERVAKLAEALRRDAGKLDDKGVSREVFRVNQ